MTEVSSDRFSADNFRLITRPVRRLGINCAVNIGDHLWNTLNGLAIAHALRMRDYVTIKGVQGLMVQTECSVH